MRLIEEALHSERLLGLVAVPDATIEEPMPGQVYKTGTLAMIQQVTRTPNNTLHVITQGVERCRVVQWVQATPYLRARIILQEIQTEARELCAEAGNRSTGHRVSRLLRKMICTREFLKMVRRLSRREPIHTSRHYLSIGSGSPAPLHHQHVARLQNVSGKGRTNHTAYEHAP